MNFNELVKPGDTVTLDLNQVESLQGDYPASGSMPDIVYEDDNILIINKPKGQKTHPNQGENGTALNDCATYLGYSPYIVHRLDMLTGGLFARGQKSGSGTDLEQTADFEDPETRLRGGGRPVVAA